MSRSIQSLSSLSLKDYLSGGTLLIHKAGRRTGQPGKGYGGLLVLFLLQVIYFLPLDAHAQQRSRSSSSLNRAFKSSPRIAVQAGAGLTVMNSDFSSSQGGTIDLVKTKGLGFTAGLGLVYQVTPYLGALGSLDYHHVTGSPSGSPEKSGSFSSELVSATGSVLFNIGSRTMLSKLYDRSFRKGIAVVPYVKAGAGVLRYKASSTGSNMTETAGTSYPATTLVLPVGGGIRCRITQQVSLATDFTYSMPSTDYLDNKKASGSILGSNDKFASVTLKAFYTLPGGK